MRDRRFMSRWSMGFVALAAIGLGSVLLPSWGQEPGSKPNSPAALADARVKVAREALKGLQTAPPNEEIRARIAVWMRRIVKTRRELGGPKDDVMADMKAYLDQVRQLEALALANEKAGRIQPIDLLEAKYKVLEAESWLALESQKKQ